MARVGDLDAARMVAADLESYLGGLGPTLDGPVHAVALWVDPEYANLGVSFGTEPEFQRQLAFVPAAGGSGPPGPQLSGPLSPRWQSGEWEHIVIRFQSEATMAALAPLAALLADDTLDEAERCAARHRWQEIGFRAVQLTNLPATLPRTDDFLFFAECGDERPPVHAYWMLRTLPVDRFHATFPQWRRLALLARAAQGTGVMARARQAQADIAARGWPGDDPDPLPPDLSAALGDCGLHWSDFADWSDALQLALRVADTRQPIGPEPCEFGYPYEQYLAQSE
jgi:hypothetical protein